MTAAHREESIDSKDQELLAIMEKMDRKDKAQVRDFSKKIKQGIGDNERSKKT